MSRNPMLIAVAPNGARKTKLDHPQLPLTPSEIVTTAIDCLEVGASMMHFHVRNSDGNHTLNHAVYLPVLRELEAVVGDRMLLQVSSEAAGRYQAEEQIEQMKRLAPHCLSCGLREIIRSDRDYAAGNAFFSELHRAGVLVQYILYSPAEVEWYERLCDEGVIPGDTHLLLFVLGRYGGDTKEDYDLHSYVSALKRKSPWMACGFGLGEHAVMVQAVKLGGHGRVGFENNHLLPGGAPAPDNAALVKLTADLACLAERSTGDKTFAESLHGL
ncbi:MAG: 3-keto-5-aminohexanoate cleavage protein [Desulforhopalus sp.]